MTIPLPIIATLLLVAAPASAEVIGQIKNLTGMVSIARSGTERSANLGDPVEAQDAIVTGADGRVGITFTDNSRFSAGPNTRIELERFRFDPTTQEGEFITRIKRGTLAVTSGQMAKQSPEAMKIKTPTTLLGVRGTRFLVQVEK